MPQPVLGGERKAHALQRLKRPSGALSRTPGPDGALVPQTALLTAGIDVIDRRLSHQKQLARVAGSRTMMRSRRRYCCGSQKEQDADHQQEALGRQGSPQAPRENDRNRAAVTRRAGCAERQSLWAAVQAR